MGIKISLIGAGSAVFSLNLIKDICLTPGLAGSTVSLMDVDAGRLEAAYGLCRRYAEEVGMRLNLERTTDRRECLQGADFVVNTALDGGHARLREGWKIAKAHGYRFGGSLHVMHDEAFFVNFYQLRLMESILLDVLEICPNAWYVLVANPVLAGVTYMKRKYPQANIVGMCHGYGGVYAVAHALGLEKEHVTFEAPGVNHFLWLTKFFYKGQDAFPLLDKWIASKDNGYWENCGLNGHEGPKQADIYRRYGAFPIGDTCTAGGGAWGWWYHTDDAVQARWREDPDGWYESYFKWGLEGVEKIKRAAEDASVKVSDVFPGHSAESIVPLIEALACDVERVVIVNILNDGEFVPGVPKDFEVEVPALVSKKGIQGIRTSGLPKPILAWLLRDRVASVEMELEAFIHRNRELLLSLILMDPWTKNETQARGMMEAVLESQLNKEMKEYYK